MTSADEAVDEVARVFAARLAERREAQGMRPRDLAYRIDVGEREVYRWEAGTKRGPQIQTLRRLAVALETSVDYLLGLTDDPRPSEKGADPADELRVDSAVELAARLLEQRDGPRDRRSTQLG